LKREDSLRGRAYICDVRIEEIIYMYIFSLGILSLFILSFLHLLTYVYIVWATFLPLPTPHPSASEQNLLFSDFVEGKTKR
jgi:hypothetical protein